MFKFHKVRGPEQVGDAITTLEETANRLESMVEIAQKEKSRLHLLVGNVTDRVDQIKQSASGFDDMVKRIETFQDRFKGVEDEIAAVQRQADGLKELKAETTNLFEQFKKLKTEFEGTAAKLRGYSATANQLGPLNEKVNQIKTTIMPEIEAISQKQDELTKKYDEYFGRLEKADEKLQGLVKLSDDFKKTSDNVARESARISTWMEATESISNKLDQATEVFETTKQKIDSLHELAEYVENKTRALRKQKELLKKAHIESGRANGLFWEIKSKLNELEQDAEKIRQMEMQTSEFSTTLQKIESRFENINNFSKKLDQILNEYARLEEYGRQLQEHRKQLTVVDELFQQINKHIEVAKDERSKLAQAEQQINLFIKRSEESQNESRALIRQMTELMQNAEKFLQRAPDVGKALTQIESIRKRALVLENKIMEVMASTTEIKNQSEKAAEVKKAVDQFNQDVDQKIANQKKELVDLSNNVGSLKNSLDMVQTNWNKVPQLMDKLAELEKMQRELDKTYKSVMQREQTVTGLKNLMEQNNVAFKEFEKTSSEIHNKATEILNVKSELENIDYRVKSLATAAKQLAMMSERIEKTENEMETLAENFTSLNNQVKNWQTQSANMKTECSNISKTHEDLRTNIGEVMDLFTRLAELRTQADNEAKRLNGYFQQAEQKVRELSEISGKSSSESGAQIDKMTDIKESIKQLSAGQDELMARFNSIESESAKLTSLANAIKEKQMEMASLEEKANMLEGKIKEAEKIQKRVDGFEKAFDKFAKDMDTISKTLLKMESVNKEFDSYRNMIVGFEAKINAMGEQAKRVEKLKADINRASLMAEELKARQNSLKDEKDLINKAILAATKLEELVYRAEHISKEKK